MNCITINYIDSANSVLPPTFILKHRKYLIVIFSLTSCYRYFLKTRTGLPNKNSIKKLNNKIKFYEIK